MSGCRIRSVTDKATGRRIDVLSHGVPNMLDRVRREAVRLTWDGGADAWAIVGFWRDRNGGDKWHVEYEVYREAGIFTRMWPDAVRSVLEKRINEKSY